MVMEDGPQALMHRGSIFATDTANDAVRAAALAASGFLPHPRRTLVKLIGFAVMFLIHAQMYFFVGFLTKFCTAFYSMPEFVIGSLYIFFPVGTFIASFLFGPIQNYFGIRGVTVSGLLVCTISLVMFGLVPTMVPALEENAMTAAYCFGATQLLAGIGGGLVSTPAFAAVTSLFPDKSGIVIAQLNVAVGAGASAGPLIGGSLFSAFNHMGGLKAFKFTSLIVALVPLLILPALSWLHCEDPEDDIESVTSDENDANDEFPEHKDTPSRKSSKDSISGGIKVDYWSILTPMATMSLFVRCVSETIVATLDPSLAARAAEPSIGFDEAQASSLFTIAGCSYMLASFAVGSVLDRFPKNRRLYKMFMILGAALMAAAFVLMGPLTKNLDRVEFLVLGCVARGIAGAFFNCVYQDIIIDVSDTDAGALMAAGALFSSANFAGWSLGPLLGGWLLGVGGFKLIALVCALMAAGLAVVMLGPFLRTMYEHYHEKSRISAQPKLITVTPAAAVAPPPPVAVVV